MGARFFSSLHGALLAAVGAGVRRRFAGVMDGQQWKKLGEIFATTAERNGSPKPGEGVDIPAYLYLHPWEWNRMASECLPANRCTRPSSSLRQAAGERRRVVEGSCYTCSRPLLAEKPPARGLGERVWWYGVVIGGYLQTCMIRLLRFDLSSLAKKAERREREG